MNEIKLKPCPFCGREAATQTTVIHRDIADCIRYAVGCPACRIELHSDIEEIEGTFKTTETAMQKAIEAWNRRAENETD